MWNQWSGHRLICLGLTEMHSSEFPQLSNGDSERPLHDNPVNYLSTRGCGQTSLICHPLSWDNIGNFNSGNMLSCSLEDLESFNIRVKHPLLNRSNFISIVRLLTVHMHSACMTLTQWLNSLPNPKMFLTVRPVRGKYSLVKIPVLIADFVVLLLVPALAG